MQVKNHNEIPLHTGQNVHHKQINKQQVLERMWRKGNSFALLVRKRTGVPQKIENGSAFWNSDPISGNISEVTQNYNSEEHKHPYVHCSIIYNCQDVEAALCPSVDEWIKQLWDIYTMEFYSAIRKKKNLPFAMAWMVLENIMLNEMSVRKRQVPYDLLICGI